MKSDRHYYIVNVGNGNVLAPYITKDDWYSMSAGIDVYQYNQTTIEYKNQYKAFRESFKWMIEFVDIENNLVRFNNKWSGMYLAVKNDSNEVGIQLCQAKDGSINWKLLERDKHTYQIDNDLTGGSAADLSMKPSHKSAVVQARMYFPEASMSWMLVEANIFENGDYYAATLPAVKLKDISSYNNWYEKALPKPTGSYGRGVILSDRIDTIGKMLGIFPQKNDIQKLYQALVLTLKQIIKQTFLEDSLNNLIRDLFAARAKLKTFKYEKDKQRLKGALDDAMHKYDAIIDRLTVSELKDAGFVLFMQVASEQLAIIHAIESLAPGSTLLRETAQNYTQHLLETYSQIKKKRISLIKESPTLYATNRYTDAYQRKRHVNHPDNEAFYTLNDYIEMMGIHFDTEFGNPVVLAHSWTARAV
ncbi:MAG: hypothetical protein DWQ04_10220 [Chloroflexi bacterium]|nr:MAG: hypothetical protein DWQ04_10220 [Chloroflexota bacterium]